MAEQSAATTSGDAAEQAALAADARLVRDVRRRLVAWSGGTTLVVLVALGIALYVTAAQSLQQTGIAVMDQRAEVIRDRILGPRGRPMEGDTGFMFGGASSGTFALVAGPNGRALLPGPGRLPQGLPDQAGIDEARRHGRHVRATELAGVPVRVLTEQVPSRQGPIYVQVVQDRTPEQQTLDVILAVLVVGGLVVILVAVGVGAAYARRALVPINTSLASQRVALRRQREFAADASHELRTPLTVIRSNLEHLRRHRDDPVGAVGDAIDDIDAEVRQMTALVEDLLLLARSDSGAVPLDRVPLDLGDVAATGAAALARPAEARGVRLVVDPEPAIVTGDPARLRQLVTILVDNAIRHSPAGGEIRVQVRPAAESVTLDVEDEGPGIRTEDLPRVFDRFWRAPGAHGEGTGLGLAIAAWIVERHGGRISVVNRSAGGAHFTVRLPAAPAGS
jgi:signal transduction histidine kinase